MSEFKTKMKVFWRIVRECFIGSLTPGMMYFAAALVNLLIISKENWNFSTQMVLFVVCGVVALVYDGLLMWLRGGNHYEMLVSGNMKRRSAMNTGTELNITSYKFEKEYRPWKGFVMGAFNIVPLIIGAIVFGLHQNVIGTEDLHGGLQWLVLIFDVLAGWALLPLQQANITGRACSYFLGILLAVLPVAVSGALYIGGAYGRRNKTLRQQEIAARAAEAEANKPKKINYGGLPGTKPKKKK